MYAPLSYLPPGVDYRATASAYNFVVPIPRLGINRFPHAPEHPQRGQLTAVSIRQHTSAYVSIRQRICEENFTVCGTVAYVSIREHT